MATGLLRDAEGKYRTNAQTKRKAAEIYSRWGLSLSDAINVFLIKSVEVGGLPFDMRDETPAYELLQKLAYHAPINEDGVAVLPSDWDDDE